jgi:hypothetical protein
MHQTMLVLIAEQLVIFTNIMFLLILLLLLYIKKGDFACDFPSLIGRDEYYGGLGGEFTISTRSLTSGTKVLRHEMGHNFASVGEEYEGGNLSFFLSFFLSIFLYY